MKRTLFLAILLLLASLSIIATIEKVDTLSRQRAEVQALARQLQPLGARLQATLDEIVAINRGLTEQVAALPRLDEATLGAIVGARVPDRALIRSVVISRKLNVVFVDPAQGNEPLIGLDYGLHPEFMAAINRAVATRRTATDTVPRLLQTGQAGLIVRTPVFAEDGEFTAMVSMAVDVAMVIERAGLLDANLGFLPLLRQPAAEPPNRDLYGDRGLFPRVGAWTRVALPDGEWQLGAAPKLTDADDGARMWWIRGLGALATLVALLALLWRQGALAAAAAGPGQRGVSLRTLLLLAVLLPIPLLVPTAGWLSFRASAHAVERLESQQTAELAKQVRDKVGAFFEVPRQVAAFNADLFRHGLLDPNREDALISSFLSQFRQQPLLTFLSFGNAEGEYFAASRPPLGTDKTLRVLRATAADGRVMKLFRADDANHASSLVSVGNAYFDARTRPWYTAAIAAGRLKWYPAYRYAIHDRQGLYDTLGIGMSTPLYDPERRFLGVVSADVALSQLGSFLAAQVADFGGTAFLAESDGTLLASSAEQPVFRLDDAENQRIRGTDSENPCIRVASETIRDTGAKSGSRRILVDGREFLLDWQTVQLPDGPTLTVALALPDSRFSRLADSAFRDIGYLTLLVVGLGLVIALALTYWFSQPLLLLERWAQRLGTGEWRATLPVSSPIREVAGLTASLGAMAEQLQAHADELEQRVAERTCELEAANRRFAALSLTDGLTGIANRRRFDEAIEGEWARAARNGSPLALLMIDVDHFKAYNDRYGHQAGDEALRLVASLTSAAARRPGDLSARYGGEEFALLAAETSREAALALAETIRDGLVRTALPHAGSPLGVLTVSIGVAVARPALGADIATLIGLADAALYRAKATGRNRTELA